MKTTLSRILTALLAAALLWLIPPANREALAQGLKLVDSAGSNVGKIDGNGNLFVKFGRDDATGDACYIASAGGVATTALYNLSIESPASNKIAIERICVGVSNATAAAAVTVTTQRRTTASSGGTALTAEGTGTTAVSKLDPADGNFSGVARLTGTLGTAGAVVDQWGFMIGELGAGTADVSGLGLQCKSYGPSMAEKAIIIASGVTNGIAVNVSAPGAGGLASGSLSIEFCVR